MVGLILWAILLIIIGFALLPWWVLPAFAVVLIAVIVFKKDSI